MVQTEMRGSTPKGYCFEAGAFHGVKEVVHRKIRIVDIHARKLPTL